MAFALDTVLGDPSRCQGRILFSAMCVHRVSVPTYASATRICTSGSLREEHETARDDDVRSDVVGLAGGSGDAAGGLRELLQSRRTSVAVQWASRLLAPARRLLA